MSIEKIKKFVKKHDTEIAFFTGALLACVGWYISDMQISGGNHHYLATSVSELNKIFRKTDIQAMLSVTAMAEFLISVRWYCLAT